MESAMGFCPPHPRLACTPGRGRCSASPASPPAADSSRSRCSCPRLPDPFARPATADVFDKFISYLPVSCLPSFGPSFLKESPFDVVLPVIGVLAITVDMYRDVHSAHRHPEHMVGVVAQPQVVTLPMLAV